MKLIQNNKQKFYATLLLGFVLGLILWNNTVERKTIKELQNSFHAIYEDRLLAETYVFQLSEHLHQKLDLLENPSLNENSDTELNLSLDFKIEQLNLLYASTKLTAEEEIVFESFKNNINDLQLLETQMHLSGEAKQANAADIKSFKSQVLTSLILLSELSEIHIIEGKKIIDEAKLSIKGSNLTSELEMGIIIIIAIIMQMLILSSKPVISPIEQKSSLN